MSNLFGQNLRKIDIACRFGGEEFAIIVPETTGEDAFTVADKLRKVIGQTLFPGVPQAVTVTLPAWRPIQLTEPLATSW